MKHGAFRFTANSKTIGKMASLILLCFGMHCILRGIVMPAIQHDFDLTYTELSTIVSFASVGYFVVAIFSSKISEKVGQKRALSFYAAILMLTSLFITVADQWILLTALFCIAGGAYGGIESMGTAVIKRYNPKNSDIAVNNAFGFYSIGSLFIAVLGGWLLFSGFDWRTAYYIVAFFSAVALVYSIAIKEGEVTEISTRVDLSQLKDLFKDRIFVPMCFATALLSGVEAASINWMNTFLSNTIQDMNIFETSCTTAIFFAGIYIGRIINSKLLRKLDSTILTIFCGLLSGSVVLVISFVNTARLILACIVLFGLCVSCLYPLLVSITNGLSHHGVIYSCTFTMISIFNFGVNYLMGVVADWLGLPSAFRLCAFLYLVVAIVVLLCRKKVIQRRFTDTTI